MKPDRETISRLKKAIRALPGAMASGDVGEDLDNMIAVIDLEDLLFKKRGSKFTERQRYVLRRCLIEGYTEQEVSKELGISQQSVSYSLSAALVKLYKLLTDTQPKKTVSFTQAETQRVVELYNKGHSEKSIAIELNKPLKSIRNKIRYLREKGLIGVVPKVRSEDTDFR